MSKGKVGFVQDVHLELGFEMFLHIRIQKRESVVDTCHTNYSPNYISDQVVGYNGLLSVVWERNYKSTVNSEPGELNTW